MHQISKAYPKSRRYMLFKIEIAQFCDLRRM